MSSTNQPQQLVLLGCGGHARSVADVALFNTPNLRLLFVDENARDNETIWGFSVVKHLPKDATDIHIAFGSNEARERLYVEHNPKSVISKKAHFGKNTTIGKGCFIAHLAYVGPDVTVGNTTILNTACVVEHEVRIGNFCHIAPNTTICGRVTIGDSVWVGVGGIIKEGVTIADNVTIGAGAVVVADITEAGTYVGVPAKRLS